MSLSVLSGLALIFVQLLSKKKRLSKLLLVSKRRYCLCACYCDYP